MGQVHITVNGRDYRISCDDGQEERLRGLAAYVEERIDDLVDSVGNVGDLRLMVMASLVIADSLFDATAEVERLRAERTPAVDATALGPLIEALAARIEDIAAGLESA